MGFERRASCSRRVGSVGEAKRRVSIVYGEQSEIEVELTAHGGGKGGKGRRREKVKGRRSWLRSAFEI